MNKHLGGEGQMEAISSNVHPKGLCLSLFSAILMAHRGRALSWMAALWSPAPSAHLPAFYCAPGTSHLLGARPALGACPTGRSPPGCASPLAGKAASQPTAGRAWLWQNFRNPYSPSKMINCHGRSKRGSRGPGSQRGRPKGV